MKRYVESTLEIKVDEIRIKQLLAILNEMQAEDALLFLNKREESTINKNSGMIYQRRETIIKGNKRYSQIYGLNKVKETASLEKV